MKSAYKLYAEFGDEDFLIGEYDSLDMCKEHINTVRKRHADLGNPDEKGYFVVKETRVVFVS